MHAFPLAEQTPVSLDHNPAALCLASLAGLRLILTSSQLDTPRLKALWLEAGACTLNHRLKAIDTASMLKGLALWIDAHVGATLGSTLGKSQRKDPVEGHNWIRTKPPPPSSAQ